MQTSSNKFWDEACKHLKQTLSEDMFDKWISIIQCQSITPESAELAVENDFYKRFLEDHYIQLIETALAAAIGQELKVVFSIDSSIVASVPEEEPIVAEKSKPLFGSKRKTAPKPNNLNKNYTFDAFVVGPSNQFAHAAAIASAQSPSRAYNPLFIHGDVGLGKTHLMQSIGSYILSKKPKGRVCYTTCEAFTNEYIEALQTSSLPQFRKKYRTVDALLIDDIHFLAKKERLQEEFFHTFNAIFENHKQIVMTSDRPAAELEGLAPRLVSRFEWGLVTEMESPDLETRVAILRTKSVQLDLAIDQDLLFYIAERISSNIRRLEGALIRVASYVSLTGLTMDRTKIEHLLRDTLDQEKKFAISVDSIQKVVAEHFDIRVADILGAKRPKNIAWPRQVGMYLSRKMTDLSFPVIGQAFNRNHATVVHACKEVEKQQSTNLALRQTLSHLQQKIGHHCQTNES